MGTNTVRRGEDPILPSEENPMSKRYLQILEKWIPVGIKYFEEWPEQPNCGHFFGGCRDYGDATIAGSLTFATVAEAPGYDETATGVSREELREMALRGLRYLCFTHDTGPEDCVRPEEGLGRSRCCGTKWGERGKRFFRQSTCGRTVGAMAITARLLGDAVDEETWLMLQAIHEDYAGRFGEIDPKGGVYWDTQMEENAWTSFGLASVELFLSNDPEKESWKETARRFMFSTTAAPQDSKDDSPLTNDHRVNDLTNRTYTTLPDYMAENHGFVHPSYTAASVSYLGRLGVIYGIFDENLPPHARHNRQKIYDQLKFMTDSSGLFHPAQGMDWPYLSPNAGMGSHAAAALLLEDPDAAALERRRVETLEACQDGNNGYLHDPEIIETVRDQNDLLIMRERQIMRHATYPYLLHRLYGVGPEPTSDEALEERLSGTRTYPHAGFILNRHENGQSSLSWRNSIMALPTNSDGIHTVAPASESFLARVKLEDRGDSQELVSRQIDQREGAFAINLVMDRNEGAVRQEVLFASLPTGTVLSWERLTARDTVTVTGFEQGFLRIINEDHPSIDGNCRGERTLYTPTESRVFPSFVSEDPDDDIVESYEQPAWINVDDRLGIVHRGDDGITKYHNRHYYDTWRAVADDLTLCQYDTPIEGQAGETLGELAALIAPDQSHDETAHQELHVLTSSENAVGLLADGYLVAGNFASELLTPTLVMKRDALDAVPIPVGRTELGNERMGYQLSIAPRAANLYPPVDIISTDGCVEITADETGSIVTQNVDDETISVHTERSNRSIELGVNETKTLR